MEINKLDTVDSNETKIDKFTRPLRGLLGGREYKIENYELKSEKIYSTTQRIFAALALIFSIVGLLYTIPAAIALSMRKRPNTISNLRTSWMREINKSTDPAQNLKNLQTIEAGKDSHPFNLNQENNLNVLREKQYKTILDTAKANGASTIDLGPFPDADHTSLVEFTKKNGFKNAKEYIDFHPEDENETQTWILLKK